MRIDKFLWCVRFYKTRSIAADEIKKNRVSVANSVVKSSKEIKPGDVISVKDSDKELTIIKSSLEATHNRVEFITYDDKKMVATYVRYPERSELNGEVNESLIVEFYNR